MIGSNIKLGGFLLIAVILLFLLALPSKQEKEIKKNAHLAESPTLPSNISTDEVKTEIAEKHTTPSLSAKKEEDYIIVCEGSINQDDALSETYFNEPELRLANNQEKLIPILEQINDLESNLAEVLIDNNDNPIKTSESYRELSEKYPDNNLISYDLLSSCTSREAKCERSIIDKGIALEHQNGAIWLLAAIYELNNNNTYLAIESLNKFSNSPYYNEYWGDHFQLMESALLKAGAGNELPTQAASMKYAASAPIPNFASLVSFCKNIEPNMNEIAESCLTVGKQLANGNGTMLTHLMGLTIQESIHNMSNDEDQLLQVHEAREEFNKTIKLSAKATSLVWQSSQRTSDWLNDIKANGEVNATKHIVSEAIKLSSDSQVDPCIISW